MAFYDLVAEYGTAENIPNDKLYDFLLEMKENLANRVNGLGLDAVRDSDIGKEVRRRCKRDLLWLAAYFLWETNPEGAGKPISENRITEDSHGVICREFFVQKDDSKKLADQSPIKNRLILWPRGGMKTTLDIADTVQWILNFPEIRILFLSAGSDFATQILDETKGHFVVKIGEPSLMNIFFPEFCKEEKDMGNESEYVCPVWAAKQVRRREPTILAAGIDSTLSGKHFELIKGDDMVSNRNSENDDQCRKVTKNFNINKKMLMPFGYIDLIGTRYSDVDLYGELLERNTASMAGNMIAETKRGRGWELHVNPDMSQIILIGRAIQIKPKVAEQLDREGKEVSYVNAGEEGCILLLPETQTYKFLCGDFAIDEVAFEGQRNQNPRPSIAVTFDRPLLERNTIPYHEMPRKYRATQMWDFAISKKKGRDFSVGSNVLWDDENKMYVNDLVRDRFKPAALAQAVVAFAVKHKPEVVAIEDAAGARFLEPHIQAEARKTKDDYIINLMLNIRWITPDNQKDAKTSRMASLHPWLVDGRLKFANTLPHLEKLYGEFEKCLISSGHDDIPDDIAYQVQIAPAVAVVRADVVDDQTEARDRQTAILQAGWNLLFQENCDAFGNPGMGTPPSMLQQFLEPMEEDFQGEAPPSGLDNILGAGIFG